MIHGDVQRLQQVMVNLMSNAVKFTSEGFVRVGIHTMAIKDLAAVDIPEHVRSRGGIWLLVSVRDTGIGIGQDSLEIIFDVFRQADGSSVREFEGTGLGLAITQRLVKMHNGHIWVDSTVGEGSTFYVLLPTNIPTPYQGTPQQAKDGRPLVIIADDDETTLHLLEDYIGADHYQVVTTIDAGHLIELAQKMNPAVIITDIMMPRMSGLELLHHLKTDKFTKNIPVIILSILDKQREGLEAGAAAYLTKPVTQHELLSTLAEIYEKTNN
jgi:CheY-like chemotaxis protein